MYETPVVAEQSSEAYLDATSGGKVNQAEELDAAFEHYKKGEMTLDEYVEAGRLSAGLEPDL